MGGFDVPEDVPGVVEGLDGAVMAGWPSPGVRFVLQPNAANDAIAAAAANPRQPLCKCCVFLSIEASSFSRDCWLFRATGEPKSVSPQLRNAHVRSPQFVRKPLDRVSEHGAG